MGTSQVPLEPVRMPRGSPFPPRGGSLSPKASRGFRKRPEGSQKLPMSSPVPAPVALQGPQSLPRRTQETARGCPEAPKRLPRLPEGFARCFPRRPEVYQNRPLSCQRLHEDAQRCSRCSRKGPRHSKGSPMPSRMEALSLENLAGRPERENTLFWEITSSTKRF